MKSATEYTVIAPHGGELVDRLGPRALSDLEMISTGVFSPLAGFMVREDYESVAETMHLANGLVWSMPITLSVSDDEANGIVEGDEVALVNGEGRVVATMTVADRYAYDKDREAREV